jgi:hypothetical protein
VNGDRATVSAVKSYLKPLPSTLPYLLYWIAGVAGTVIGTVAIGLYWAGVR